MSKSKKTKGVIDHQQEYEDDPVLVPNLAEMQEFADKLSSESMAQSNGEDSLDYSEIFETICGTTDDSQDVEQYDGTLGVTRAFVNRHQRPVGVLRWNSNLASIYDNPGNVAGVRWCTGTLISNNLFLTAGHCFDQTGGRWQRPRRNGSSNIISPAEIARNMSVEFGYQKDASGSIRTPTTISIRRLVEYRLGRLDFAIVELAGTPGTQFGYTKLARNVGNQGDMLCIIGHPAGRPKRIEAGPLTSASGDSVRYNDIDTLGGNSGSGVLRAADGCIIGVHTNGGCNAAMTGSNRGVNIDALRRESPTIRRIGSHGTNPVLDTIGTNPSRDLIGTHIPADTKLIGRNTDRIGEKISRGRNTDRIRDIITRPGRDAVTSVTLDNRGTLKGIDDRKIAGLDKQFSDRKLPGSDGLIDPLRGVIRGIPRIRGEQPFILATPHHANIDDYDDQYYDDYHQEIDAEAVEQLAQIEQQIEELTQTYDAILAEYSIQHGYDYDYDTDGEELDD